MTKPGFIRKRFKLLFASDDVFLQSRVVDNYKKIRGDECYCGHTTTCDCGDPGISEFKSSLYTKSISEETLSKLL